MTPRKNLTAHAMLAMQRALSLEPQTIADLVTISGLNTTVVRRFMREIRKEIHIAGYEQISRGKWPAKYAWGKCKDAVRPGLQMSSLQRMQATRARRKAAA